MFRGKYCIVLMENEEEIKKRRFFEMFMSFCVWMQAGYNVLLK